MQATVPFQVKSAVSALQGFARQIALPHEHYPERYPSFPALERTAVIGFNAPLTWSIPVTTDSFAMVARQAVYPLWLTTAVTDAAYFMSSTHDLNNDAHAFTAAGIYNNSATAGIPSITGFTGSIPTTQPILGVDASDALPFVYVPQGWYFSFVVSKGQAWGAVENVEVVYETWRSPGELGPNNHSAFVPSVAANFSIATTQSTFTDAQWIRPRGFYVRTGAAQGNTVTITTIVHTSTITFTGSALDAGGMARNVLATKTALVPAMEAAEFQTSPVPWLSTRTTATAALFTNVTQVLNKNGTVLCGRINPAANNPFQVSRGVLTNLHPAEKAFLPMETGAYTFVPPSTDLARFYDYTISGTTSVPCYNLANDSLVNVLCFYGTTVEQLAINVDWHLEFRTTSALFQIGLSTVTLETLHQAQIALAKIGFFFPNSGHKALLGKVIAAAKQLASAVAPAVKPAMRAAAMAAIPHLPGPPGLGRAASYLLSSKPGRPPPTTSAKGSGIVPSKSKKPTAKPKAKAKRK